MKPCPRCGNDTDGFLVKTQMHGPAESYYSEDGDYLEMNTDRLWTTTSDVVRCAHCYKIRRDVYLDDDNIIKEKEIDMKVLFKR